MKNYESHVNNFVGVEKLEYEEFNKKFIQNCSEVYNNPIKKIYRGVDLTDDYYIIDPTKRIRKSRNTENYYTLIMSHSEEWKHIPPRNNSIICSFDKNTASGYGCNVYEIIPYDNSIWGVSNTWIKIFNNKFNLMDFNRELDIFAFKINIQLDQDNYENFMIQLKNMTTEFLNYNFEQSVDLKVLNVIKNIMIKNDITLDKAILKVLKPNENIQACSYQEVLKSDYRSELWTNSICLLKNINID
jgi:hypothetical protein